jgi:hypothetical protein
MRIKAIETNVCGVYYRSRLEARWRIWFDSMGIPVNYEQVGFDVCGTRYLPDFEVPEWGWHIEIKPDHITRMEAARIGRLFDTWGAHTEGALAVIRGVPAYGQYTMRLSDDPTGSSFVFAVCRRCDGMGYVSEDGWGLAGSHSCGDHERRPMDKHPRILSAYEQAMKAKFDHLCQGGCRP